jgi:ornithine carbamoyltransferase
MEKQDLITLDNLTKKEIQDILDLATRLKADREYLHDQLHRKNIGLVFQKPSNRTRTSFEVGVYQLGGNCLYLGPNDISLGVRETTHDVAKTLSRYLDGIVARTFSHEVVTELAKHATVPVINGLCDLYHPCQGLTDLLTIQERFGTLEGLTLAYVGDGNNVCHSLMLGCAKVGMNINIATPPGYEPDTNVIQSAMMTAEKSGSQMSISNSPVDAVKDANAVYADVWVSMGQEEEREKRLKDFEGFQINKELMAHAKRDHIFLHCLPAHRGEEVTADIIDGEHSVVFDQAENRLHSQKAALIILIRTHKDHT